MGTYRMYTGADGRATWEEIDLDKQSDWLDGIDVTQIKFGARPPGVLQDWHPAPQRQFVIILSGSASRTVRRKCSGRETRAWWRT